MTKTIEFVEKEIKNSKEFLDRAIRYNLTICLKNETEKLEVLEQIKCELEAWEVVKRELVLTVKEDKHKYDFVYYWLIYHPYELLEIEKKDYEILKKALEVENDK